MVKKVIEKIKKSKIAKNSIWMIIETVFQMIISLFVNIIVARYLGRSNYGIINYGLSFVNFCSGICTLGLNTITIKYLVKNKEKQGKTLGTCIAMRIITSFLSVVLISILLFILKADDKIIRVVAFLQSISLIFDSFNTISLWYQYKLQSRTSAIISFIAYIFMAAYKLLLVYFKKSVVWFGASNIVLSFIIALLLYIVYRKQKNQKLSIDFKWGKVLLGESYHFIISSLMVAIYAQTDKMMIGSMIDDIGAVGLYSVSITIMQLWSFLPTAIINSFKPPLLEIYNSNKIKYLIKLKQLYSIIIWLSIAYTTFIFIFGKYIVLILYGKDYIGCLTSLRLVIFGVAFSFIGVIREFWLVCEGKQKYSKYFALFGALFNIIFNAILIPKFGINGAAIATVVTQILTGIFIPAIIPDTRISVKHIWDAFRFKFN